MTENHSTRQSRWRYSRPGLALLAFAAIAVYFLAMEHKAHLSGLLYYLPFLLLLACPLLHIFMHGGHGGHGGASRNRDDHEH